MFYDDATVQSVTDPRERYILSSHDVLEQEVRRAARRCKHLTSDDLYAQAVLHLLETYEYSQAAGQYRGYIRISVRNFLARYTLEHDSLVRTPRAHDMKNVHAPYACASLDSPVGEDGGAILADLIPGPVSQGDEYGELRQALEKLTEIQRAALLARFNTSGLRLRSLRDVSKDVGLSLGTTQRTVEGALEILRRELVGEVAV